MEARCVWWPKCECAKNLFVWSFVLRNGEHLLWDREDLEAISDVVFFSLCCAAKRCPNDEVRAKAKRELREKFWDDQKSRSMMEQ